MAEVNNVRVAGTVTWFQNWTPQPGRESWGGTLALRVSLPPDQIYFSSTGETFTPVSQELFVQVKYAAKDIDSPRLNFITKVLNGTVRAICIKDGRIVRTTKKDGTESVFLKTNLRDIQVSDDPKGIGQLNSAHLHGKIEKVHNEWIQIVTKTKNPKTNEWKEHYHNAVIAGSCNAAPAVGKYALLVGRIATKANNGSNMVYLASNTSFVF